MQLAALGYLTEVYHPRQVTAFSMQKAIQSIKSGNYDVLWIELPSSGRSCPPGRRAATLRQVSLWMRAARAASTLAVIFGLRGKIWQDESLAALVTDNIVAEARHQLCHYDIKVTSDSAMPSCVTYHSYTSWPCPPSLCKCPLDTEHTFDLTFGKTEGRSELRHRAYHELCCKLIPAWFPSVEQPRESSKPDTLHLMTIPEESIAANQTAQPTYPTEAK
jgi:hypothetical protein